MEARRGLRVQRSPDNINTHAVCLNTETQKHETRVMLRVTPDATFNMSKEITLLTRYFKSKLHRNVYCNLSRNNADNQFLDYGGSLNAPQRTDLKGVPAFASANITTTFTKKKRGNNNGNEPFQAHFKCLKVAFKID
ncbi:Hypothetical predicted protein [Scomber scombrus]|uniref:Uncharacterized protein n=1 Tax=Scomber scombrus TaxID=13677 RepID=A0AAV1PKM6_SCOSC